MKKYFIIIILFLGCVTRSYGSTLLNNYRNAIQQKIDQNIPINIDTFTDFIETFEQRLEDESQKFMGLKPYIKNIVTFVKNISLQESTIIENPVTDYGESFTIQAVVDIANQHIPVRFTIASNVHDIEHYSFAINIPDDIKVADLIVPEMKIFDNLFKDRWIIFTQFDHTDLIFGSVIKGLNVVASSDAQTVAKSIPSEFAWLKNLVGYTIPIVNFSGSIPLAIFGLVPFFIGSTIPQGISFELLQSLIKLKGKITVDKALYSNKNNSGITAVVIESCDFSAGWGTGRGLQKLGFASEAFNIDFGVTTRISSATGPDIRAYGNIEFKPLATIIHGKVDGEIKNPFGIPWLSLYNMGFDFPLTTIGTGIAGIGVRAQAGLGSSRFEVAGKAELGLLQKSGLVLHGKAEKIPFSAFTSFIRDESAMFGWIKSLELDHAQVTIACADTVIAGKEFKSGVTVRAQVGHSVLDKKAGFQLYAYNTGTYYQLFGNGYLPKVKTDAIIFEAVDSFSDNDAPQGPRFEFNYAFDFAFEKFMQAVVKANGRIKIGSFFDGTADIDLNSMVLARNVITDWKNFFVAFLRGQKLIVKGKLFNTLGAHLQILESKDKDVYVNVSLSQEVLTGWEKRLRETIVTMKDSINSKIELIDQQIAELTFGMNDNALDALERAGELVEENNRLRKENDDLKNRIKNTPWKEIYKAIPLKIKQGYNSTLIASNADLLNTILMHGAFNETSASTFAHLRKAKSGALSLINGIAQVTSLGVGLLGIEKIEAQGWLQEIMYNKKPLYLTVVLKVMGQEKVISELPFDGAHPFDSTKDLIMAIIEQMIV